MASSKFKVTGFTRFLIFMLIAAPTVFVAASYINGEDGIQNLKNLFSGQMPASVQTEQIQEEAPKAETTAAAPTKAYVNSEIKRLQDELTEKENRVKDLYLENEQLKEAVANKEAELEAVTEQLEKIKSAIGQ